MTPRDLTPQGEDRQLALQLIELLADELEQQQAVGASSQGTTQATDTAGATTRSYSQGTQATDAGNGAPCGGEHSSGAVKREEAAPVGEVKPEPAAAHAREADGCNGSAAAGEASELDPPPAV